MIITLLLFSIGLLLLSSLFALFANEKSATRLGAGGAMAACLIGLSAVGLSLISGVPASLRLAWAVPGGSFYVAVDALSAFFLLPILLLSLLSAVYGLGYLKHMAGKRKTGRTWVFFNILIASMMLVLIARNGVLFLVAWEIMALSSYFLVTFEDEHDHVRSAGLIYLVATHLGTAFLLPMFLLLSDGNGSLDFDNINGAALSITTASLIFVFAVVGFGTKAGFMPFHVWLPEAHPAAPTHVSALMSGVMIKTGIYGIVRVLTFLPEPPLWWGWLLIVIGFVSGVLGMLFAIAQHDLKRLLAYSSVENIGVISLGLGLGLIGLSLDNPLITAFGFAGGLLHVLNHALFKGLLFMGAGAVLQATGTSELDRLGGLLKKMPVTGLCFLIGAAAIAGLPPLNGFVGEFLIYFGAFKAALTTSKAALPAMAVITGLALIGCLAAACFAKVFGIIFLGEARQAEPVPVHEAGKSLLISQMILALACVFIGLFPFFAVQAVLPVLTLFPGVPEDIFLQTAHANRLLIRIGLIFAGLLAIALVVAFIRRQLLKRRVVTQGLTWDCGYLEPGPRMQYTASSFVQPLTSFFGSILGTRMRYEPPRSLFPKSASFQTHTADAFSKRVYAPIFEGIAQSFSRLRWFQHGRTQLYILYIAVVLLVLLIWKIGS